MAKRNRMLMGDLELQSEEAKKFFGKTIEDALPKPDINVDDITPSELLADILTFARPAEGRGEWLFRENWLKPWFKALHIKFIGTATPVVWDEDEVGNLVVRVGTTQEEVTSVLHVGHIDTVHETEISPLQHVTEDDKGIWTLAPIVKHSKAKIGKGKRWVHGTEVDHQYVDYELPAKQQRCLGADDGCAVAIMLHSIFYGRVGTYLFTRGEEIGCVGTHFILDAEAPLIDFSLYQRAIEVDRKGNTDLVTSMSVGRTASKEFGEAFAAALGLGHKAARGTITDVGHISKKIPECVNIAAGYNLQHSDRESTDPAYLDRLGAAFLTMDWAALPSVRAAGDMAEPKTKVVKQNFGGYSRGYTTGGGGLSQYGSRDNSYGDWTEEPSTNKSVFGTDDWLTSFVEESFIRSNIKFITEFLSCAGLSPAEMDKFIQDNHVIELDEQPATEGK